MTTAGNLVRIGRRNLRLPLTLAENLTHHERDSSWPPTFVYETVEAVALQFWGIVLGDHELRQEGKEQEQRLMTLSAAQDVRAEADRIRQEADDELEQRRAEAEQARRDIERRDASARDAIERAETERQAKAARKAADENAQSTRRAAESEDRVRRQKRAADRTRIGEEQASLAERQQALDAERRAEAVDDAFEHTKNGHQ